MAPKDARNAAVIEAVRSSEKLSDIATRFGISRQRVGKIARRAGIHRAQGRPRKLPDMDAATRAHYVKMRDIMGPSYARAVMGISA